MATPEHSKFQITPFWTDSYKTLDYEHERFNDPDSLAKWRQQGYGPKFTGVMCDMRKQQPVWNQRFVELFSKFGWQDVGTSYYRMDTGTVLPTHRDLYKKYIEIFKLQGKENSIRRAVVFLEDWKPGHYSELNGVGLVNWTAGTTIEWTYDAAHAAANIGLEPRYTVQITGHL